MKGKYISWTVLIVSVVGVISWNWYRYHESKQRSQAIDTALAEFHQILDKTDRFLNDSQSLGAAQWIDGFESLATQRKAALETFKPLIARLNPTQREEYTALMARSRALAEKEEAQLKVREKSTESPKSR